MQFVRAAGDHTCAGRSDGMLACWGGNATGQLGDGTRGDRASPTAWQTGVVELATGPHHTCAVTSAGGVRCWGRNEDGEVDGIPSSEPILTPADVGLPEMSRVVAVGGSHTCSQLQSDAIWCWGLNAEGQLGRPNSSERGPPAASNLPFPVALTAGDGHTCVLDATLTVSCTGRNNELQIDTMPGDAYTPRPAITNASRLEARGWYSCALVLGDVQCWGDNMFGQLANGGHDNRGTPATVVTPASRFWLGARHGCARPDTTNETYCWGANDNGQLGDGTRVSTTQPVRAAMFDTGAYLTLGDRHTCMISLDGTIECVGDNSRGQLGDGTPPIDPKPSPAPISCP
jgi:alpha-tubulin suppressor-like RCC1 family protein